MSLSSKRILDEIDTYIQKLGGNYDELCCGTSAYPWQELASHEGVLYRDAGSELNAHEIAACLAERGCRYEGKGGPDAQYVYVYRMMKVVR